LPFARPRTYYEATALGRIAFPQLKGAETSDVCVIGGGIAGCSAALGLAEKGYRVVLLEAERIGWGASGRSGGQIIPGFACDQSTLEQLVEPSNAKRMWDISVDAIRLLRERIAQHAIQCDWRSGHLQAAIKPRHLDALRSWRDELERIYAYPGTSLLEAGELSEMLGTRRYCGGLFDQNAGHLHPLNYVLGLANAAKRAGVQIYEGSKVVSIERGAKLKMRTADGDVTAPFGVVCGNAYLGDLIRVLHDRVMPVETYVVATEPLAEARAHELIRNDCSVSDTNFVLDYFRLSADRRLLFGGRVSYSGHDAFDTARATRKRMLAAFPQLADVKIEYSWNGKLDITMNRAPDFNRLDENIYYLQGFSGHGLALAGMAGKLQPKRLRAKQSASTSSPKSNTVISPAAALYVRQLSFSRCCGIGYAT